MYTLSQSESLKSRCKFKIDLISLIVHDLIKSCWLHRKKELLLNEVYT